MKKLIIPIAAISLSISNLGFAAKIKSAKDMSDAQKQSYAAGFAQGGQLKKMNSDLDLKFNMDYFKQGFDDAYSDKKAALDDKAMDDSLVSLQKNIMEKQKVFLEKQFSENKVKSTEFLTKVKQDNPKTIKELKDGILYEVVKASKSKKDKPTLEDTVKVTYRGTTVDGKEFDSNENIELGLKSLIKGWQVALQEMTPGDKWKLYVPSDQAYGERGAPGILPNSALVFEIELIDVIKG